MTVHVDHQDPPLKSAGQSKTANSLLSRTQTEAVDFLERCVRNAEPLAALTGSAGSGKTMALNTALARCGSAGDRIIRVNNFVAGPLSLHRVLAASLGVGEAAELSAEALEPALRRALAEASKVSPPVLAVDDAQSLLPETLRYLSLLAGLRENGRPVLRILLVGRPGFTVRHAMPVQFTLETMRSDDAREVAAKRLAAAGLTLADGSVQEIVQRAQGNWRKLDALLRTETDDPARARGNAPRSETVGSRGPTSRAGAQPATRDRTAMVAASGAKAGTSRSAPSPVWMIVLPGLLLAFAGGAVIAYEGGLFGSRPAPSHPLGHAAVPAASTPVHPAAPAPSRAGPSRAGPGHPSPRHTGSNCRCSGQPNACHALNARDSCNACASDCANSRAGGIEPSARAAAAPGAGHSASPVTCGARAEPSRRTRSAINSGEGSLAESWCPDRAFPGQQYQQLPSWRLPPLGGARPRPQYAHRRGVRPQRATSGSGDLAEGCATAPSTLRSAAR